MRGALCPLMCDYESNYILGTALSTFYDALSLYNNLIKEVLFLSLFLKQGNWAAGRLMTGPRSLTLGEGTAGTGGVS